MSVSEQFWSAAASRGIFNRSILQNAIANGHFRRSAPTPAANSRTARQTSSFLAPENLRSIAGLLHRLPLQPRFPRHIPGAALSSPAADQPSAALNAGPLNDGLVDAVLRACVCAAGVSAPRTLRKNSSAEYEYSGSGSYRRVSPMSAIEPRAVSTNRWESRSRIARAGKRAFAARFQTHAGTPLLSASTCFAPASFPRTPIAVLPRCLSLRLRCGCAGKSHLPSPSKIRGQTPIPSCCAT